MLAREISATINTNSSPSHFSFVLSLFLTVKLTLKFCFFILRYSIKILACVIGTFSNPYITDKFGNTFITLTGSELAIKVLTRIFRLMLVLLYIYINSINIPPILIINRIYKTQNLLSL